MISAHAALRQKEGGSVLRSRAINLHQFIIGFSVLGIAYLEYLLLRPIHSTSMGTIVSYVREHIGSCDLFGVWGGVIPEFAHACAFALITLAFFPRAERLLRGWICLFWFSFEMIFEVGQKFSREIVSLIPPCFERVWLLRGVEPYFINGTYDHYDVCAIIAGIVAAFAIGEITMNRNV